MRKVFLRLQQAFAAVMLAAVVVACSNVPTATINDKEAIALRSVAVARQTTTALLTQGKINVAKDRAIQAQLTAIVDAIRKARAEGNIAAIDAGKVDADKVDAQLKEIK